MKKQFEEKKEYLCNKLKEFTDRKKEMRLRGFNDFNYLEILAGVCRREWGGDNRLQTGVEPLRKRGRVCAEQTDMAGSGQRHCLLGRQKQRYTAFFQTGT